MFPAFSISDGCSSLRLPRIRRTCTRRPLVLSAPTVPPKCFPGSLLYLTSVAAAPEEFVVGRYSYSSANLLDPKALAIHIAVIRWSLDEFAPSGH